MVKQGKTGIERAEGGMKSSIESRVVAPELQDLYARQDILGQALMTSFAEMLQLPPETFAQFFQGALEGRMA